MGKDRELVDRLQILCGNWIELGSPLRESGLQYEKPWDHLVEGFFRHFMPLVEQQLVSPFVVQQIQQIDDRLVITTINGNDQVHTAAALLWSITTPRKPPVLEAEFIDRSHLAPHQLSFMRAGVGMGWYPLLISLGELCEQERSVIAYAKEKGGRLRCSPQAQHPKLQYAQDFAESLSAHICEACGSPGQLVNIDGWVKAFCPRHALYYSKQK